MKATGIVRRIDDLGRVVIPKEIRRTTKDPGGGSAGNIYRPGGGDHPEEIFSHWGALRLRGAVCGEPVPDHGLSGGGLRYGPGGGGFRRREERTAGRLISRQLEKVLGERNSILACAGDKKYTPIVKDQEETYACQVISPILCEGDVIGGVIFLVRDGKKKLGEVEQKMASCAAAFLGRQMEQ